MRKNLLLTFVLILSLGLTGCFSFTDDPPEATSITISEANGKNAIALDGNKTVEFTTLIRDQKATEFEVDENKISWKVNDPTIANLDSETGYTTKLTAQKAGEAVVTASYGDLSINYAIKIFDTKPQVVVFEENFEEYPAGALEPTDGYEFPVDSNEVQVVATNPGEGEKSLALTKDSENIDFKIHFDESLDHHRISFLINKPGSAGTFNVDILGAEKQTGFQLTNGNALRPRIDGGVSGDNEIGNLAAGEWERIEVEFNDKTGKYSFYQGEGNSRTKLGTEFNYSPGESGITGLNFRHQGNANITVTIDDIVVSDLSVTDLVF